MPDIALPDPADAAACVAAWRTAARRLLSDGVPPVAVQWITAGEQASLFADAAVPLDVPAAAVRVPRRLVALADMALLHRDPERFALLYGLLWRINRGERGLLDDPADPQVRRAEGLERAVQRDIHHMTAFLRFREITGEERFVGWFEPAHHSVEAAAPFFAGRFPAMRWSILTPDRCAHWDGSTVSFTPGVARAAAPDADSLDDLWRTYYAATFNPARVNPAVLQTNMPRRYWHNLPEAPLIPALIAEAAARTQGMVEAAPTAPSRFGQAVAARCKRGGDG